MNAAVDHRLELARMWRRFAELEAASYSPLYARIGLSIAEDDELLDLVRAAPPRAHQPIMLLAAAHHLLLSGVTHPLADVYAGHAPADAASAQFRDLCLTHRDALLQVMTERRIQTNECGRSALIALGLGTVAAQVGRPDVLVDAGASAGLNLLYDRYHLNYGAIGSLGDTTSPVRIECELRRGRALPHLPDIPVRFGIDRSPIDVTDTDSARWLLACVWPDTGRLERTTAALALAAATPPVVHQGDMATDVPRLLAEVGGDGLACVVTSWAFAYLRPEKRVAFVDSLRVAARLRPVVWLSFEGPGVVDRFDRPARPEEFDIVPSVLGIEGFGAAGTPARALANVHPHGTWIDWLA